MNSSWVGVPVAEGIGKYVAVAGAVTVAEGKGPGVKAAPGNTGCTCVVGGGATGVTALQASRTTNNGIHKRQEINLCIN
jgi:hypothetical protein